MEHKKLSIRRRRIMYQRNKKAKGDPPLQQQSKRGLQKKSGRSPGWTGPQTGWSGARSGRPGANRAPTGRQPGCKSTLEESGCRPVSRATDRRVLRTVRSTGRQPGANQRSPWTKKARIRPSILSQPAGPVTGPVGPDSRPDSPVTGPVDRV